MTLNKVFLQTLLQTMECNSNICESMIERFPFHSLEEVSDYNSEVISLILDVLTRFTDFDLFYSHRASVDLVINFYSYHLSSISDVTDSSANFLRTLSNLCFLFEKASNAGTRFTIVDNLLILISDLVPKISGTEHMKHVCELLGIFLESHDLDHNDEFKKAVSLVWSACSCRQDTFMLASKMISHPTASRNPIITEAYKFFIRYIPDFNLELPSRSLNKILDACLRIFEDCTNDVILKDLSIKLIECNSLDSVKMPNLNLKYTSNVLRNQIRVLFAPFDWDPHQPEPNSFEQAIQDYVSNEETRNSLQLYLIIVYLDFIHKKDGAVSKFNPAIVAHLVEKHARNIPAQIPALKSLMLLFALYFTFKMTLEINSCQVQLFSNMQFSPKLGDLLTYHSAQLFWILGEAHPALKRRTLSLWLKRDTNQGHLVSLIKTANKVDLLCDLITHPDLCDIEEKRKALNLLLQVDNAEQSPNVVMNLLVKPNLDMKTILMLLEANPNVPDMTPQNNNGGKQKNNKEFARFLIGRFTFLYTHRMLADLAGQQEINAYLYKLLRQTATLDKELFTEVLSSKLLESLASDLEACDNKKYEKFAVKVFCFILHTQRNLKLQAEKCIRIQPKFNLSNEWMCRLLNALMRPNEEIVKPAVCIRDPVEVYYVLLDYLITPYGHIAMRCVQKLIREEAQVACAVINIFTIDKLCKSRTLNSNFVKYLLEWTAVLPKYPFLKLQVPWKELSQYVKYLDHKGYSQIDYTNLQKVVKENNCRIE